jgi:hypothetical protein
LDLFSFWLGIPQEDDAGCLCAMRENPHPEIIIFSDNDSSALLRKLQNQPSRNSMRRKSTLSSAINSYRYHLLACKNIGAVLKRGKYVVLG